MNNIRSINQINEKELDLALEGASWHDEYKDSAYIFVGGLPLALTEGDVLTIFSQFGEILDVHLPRAKETGAKRGFGFLMYEDQRSTVLAVDNLNGAIVLDRMLRVDHVREYRQPGERDAEGKHTEAAEPSRNAAPVLLNAEAGPSSLAQQASNADLDLEDPMASYIAANRSKHSKDDDTAKAERKAERARIREERARKRARSGSAKESGDGRSQRPERRHHDDKDERRSSGTSRDKHSHHYVEKRDQTSRRRTRSRSPARRDYSPPRRERR